MVGIQHKAQVVTARPRTEDVQITEDIDFKSMLLPKPILEGLTKCGYLKPSPIQKKALPLVRCGMDLIVQAKAGTGKTCVFTIAALELVKTDLPHLQAIVLAPTREIALQITDVINAIGQAVSGLKTYCFVGGYPVSQDEKNLKECHIAVGAPGRMRHLIDLGLLSLKQVRLFVLDEADKLMEDTFADDINEIFSNLPESKQVLVCSATYTPELVQFLSCYMHHGQYITPYQSTNTTLLLGIRQYVSVLTLHVDKLAKLRLKEKHLLYLLQSIPFNQCLVFSNLHCRAVSVCNMLRNGGLSAQWIAGRQDQADRVIALTQLKEQRVRVLVTTDLTARGIDVENINLIINLDVPQEHQTYLHRMGRAGRYGSHGMVISVVFEGDELAAFQKLLGAIGGNSQCVNRLPEDLKKVDLWKVNDEELEQVYGIVGPIEDNVAEECDNLEDSTDTAEKYSPGSNDESNGSVNNDGAMTNVNTVDISVKGNCSCNFYEVEPDNIEVVSGPSLFAVAEKEEHWQDVLPVVVNEFKMPLNTPVTLVGSKFIRVKLWGGNQNETIDIEKYAFSSQIINFFEEKCDTDRNFISLEEIENIFANVIESEIESKHECSNENTKSITEEKIENCKKDNYLEIYKEIEQTLERYNSNKAKLENALMQFDSFDIVGWMAVDESHNILEELKLSHYNIFEFDMVTCSAGKNHIKVSSVYSDAVNRKHDCNNHISTVDLKSLNLTPPYSLDNIAEQMIQARKNQLIKNGCKLTENGIDAKQQTKIRQNLTNASKESHAINSNGAEEKKGENQPKHLNSKDDKCASTATEKINGYKHQKKSLKKKMPNIISYKNFSSDKGIIKYEKKGIIKYEKKSNSVNMQKSKKENSVCPSSKLNHSAEENEQGEVLFSRKMSPLEKVYSERRSNTIGFAPIYNCIINNPEYLTFPNSCPPRENEAVHKADVRSKPRAVSESNGEIDSISSKLSKEEPFNQFSVRNGHQRSSSVSSEQSGPYVDMSSNLMRWQELHNVEESDSDSSEESDVLKPSGPSRVRDSYSDSTNCSYGTSVANKQKEFHSRIVKQGKNTGKKHIKSQLKSVCKNSYDSCYSEESETTNHHSFHSASSQYYGTCEDCRNSSCYDHGKCSYVNQNAPYSHENATKMLEEPYNYKEREDFDDRTYVCDNGFNEFYCRQPKSAHNLPNVSSYHVYNPNEFEPSQGYNTNMNQSSKNSNVGRSDDLFLEWYSTWYAQVRQRAEEIAMTEYTNMMSTL